MATSKSESLKKYLNDNYASSIKDADNNETYYCHFNGEYFVKCLVTETVVRKQSSNHGPMTKYNEAIAKYKESLNNESEQTSVIGFSIPSYSDDEEEEDDE